MITFAQYYHKYLGIDPEGLKLEHQVFPCERRAKPFGFFYTYHLISTVIDGSVVFSISPKLAPAFDSQRKALSDNIVNEELLRMIDDTFFDFLPALLYSTRIMTRSTLDQEDLIKQENRVRVETLSESDKDKFISQCVGRGQRFAEYLWNARVETVRAGRYFTIFENNEIASSAYISDIDYQGANIVVSTGTKFRNKGYGKAAVKYASEWCFSHGYRPIYLADMKNVPSVKLAESLGFREMSQEVVVSSYHEIKF